MMGMITSIRAPVPVAETPLAPPTEARRTALAPAEVSAVAPPVLVQSVLQTPSKPFVSDPHLLAARTTVETSAAEAAEAAREAYIRASIAAGISPLPLS